MSLIKEKLELKLEEAEYTTQKSLARFSSGQKKFLAISLLGIIPIFFLARFLGNLYFAKQFSQYIITAKPSFTEAKNLIIDRIDIATLGNNEYAIVAQLINPNLDLAVKQLPFEWKFFDEKSQITAPSQKGVVNLTPNEKKYIVVPVVNSLTPITRAEIQFLEAPKWQKKKNLEIIKLTVNQPKGYDQTEPFGYVLEGNVFNQSPYLIKTVKLNFLLYGQGGKIVGASYRSEFDLPPNQKRSYKHFWPNISGKNVVRAETIAETEILNRENFKIPENEFNNEAGFLGR
jgi:hypothetical protein